MRKRGSSKRVRRFVRVSAWSLFLVFVAPALIALAVRAFSGQPHWNDASHTATGLAPAPAQLRDAIVQVYAARTWGQRGGVAVHTWIATKRTDAEHYTRYEIIGWQLRRSNSALVVRRGNPDAMWFSNEPELLVDLRGTGVEAVIDDIETAVAHYPHSHEYRTWPGPNSNTFTAHVGRQVPELALDLPPTAIGKDYIANGALFGPAPSGTGHQLSLFGAASVLIAAKEGIEVNLLGLVVGVRAKPFAIKLPGLGTWPSHTVRRSGAALNHPPD